MAQQSGRPSAARGRRPAGSGTREAIAAAARHHFATVGYPRTTLRAVARDAGVDVRLVTHYFGSKQQLFFETFELPFEPEQAFELIAAPGLEGVGERVARFMFGVLGSEQGVQTVTGLVRAAASEPEAAEMVRRILVERLLGPLAHRLGTDQPELRAALMGTQFAGMVLARHVVGLPVLVAAPPEQLILAIAPVIEHYLTEPLPRPDGPAGTPD